MKKEITKKFKRLLHGGFWHIFIGTFLNKAITMISSIVVARLVDKTQYAYLSYSDTIYGYIILFSGLGLTSVLLKVCAGNTERSQDKAYMNYAIKCGLIFEIIICTILVSACMFITLPFEEAKHFIIVYSVYPIIYFLYDTILTYLRAKQLNKFYAGINLLYSFITCVFSIGFVLIFDVMGVIVTRYVTLLIIGILCVRKLHYVLGNKKAIKLNKQQKRDIWVMALNIMIANAFSGMMPFNENLLIGNIIADEVTLANFRVAGLFPQMILLVAQAVNIYFFPIVAGMDNEGKKTKNYVKKIGLFNLGLVVVFIVLGILISPFLITTFYGSKYSDAVQISYLLWIMRGLNAGIRMVPMNMLLAIQKYKFNLWMSIVAFVLQIGLDWYFISAKGIIGVGYGTIGVYILTGVAYWVYYLRVADK